MNPKNWPGPTTGQVEAQTRLEVISREIVVDSPALPNLGFEVSLAAEFHVSEIRKRFGALCAIDPGTSIECTVFHYAIRYSGDRPIRNGRFTSDDYSIMPEYRMDGGEWKRLKSRLMACTVNPFLETPILPGETAEGTLYCGEWRLGLIHHAYIRPAITNSTSASNRTPVLRLPTAATLNEQPFER